jgi:hypothetical protein
MALTSRVGLAANDRALVADSVSSQALAEALLARAGAGQAQASRVAAMRLHAQVASLDVTETDVARGYIDVPSGSSFSVETTSREGYLVDLIPKAAIFTAVSVRSTWASAELGRDGGTIVACIPPGHDGHTTLSYRFALASDVTAGRYPFPLHLIVRPL